MSNEQVKELVNRLTPNAPTVTQHPMVVATNTPNLTVYLDGDTTNAVQANSLTGETLAVGAAGVAYWAPPLKPIVFLGVDADTGWVNLTYNAGFSAGTPGQLAYRKIGNRVWVRGGATNASNYTPGAALATVATLPASAAPVSAYRVSVNGTSRKQGALEITSAGDIQLAISADVSATVSWLSCSAHFLTD